MITKKLTCYAAKDGHSVFCMVGASGTIVRDNIPSHEAINMIDEMHDDIDTLTAERDALKEALRDSQHLLELTDKYATFPNRAYSMTPRSIETAIRVNRALLAKLETK